MRAVPVLLCALLSLSAARAVAPRVLGEVPQVALPQVDPLAPVKDLLPPAPPDSEAAVYVGDDLAGVPEVRFDTGPHKERSSRGWQERTAQQVANAKHLDSKTEDGHLEALLKERPDLAGLPFVMGKECRTGDANRKDFRHFAGAIHEGWPFTDKPDVPIFLLATLRAHAETHRMDPAGVRRAARSQMAAARQVLLDGTAANARALPRYLGGLALPEATRELALVAVYPTDSDAREGAVQALSVRRGRDYVPTLMEAFRYPWPQAARNAAEAIVKLERKELVPRLAALLEDPDPRLPREEKRGRKTAQVARELVRISHNRNCLLCHAAARVEDTSGNNDFFTDIPIPTEPLPQKDRGYGQISSPSAVDVGTTYLRQDFSAMLPTEQPGVWPAMQRFDFVVRTRELTDDEAADLRARLAKRGLSPYHRAAARAIRELVRPAAKPVEADSGPKHLEYDRGDLRLRGT